MNKIQIIGFTAYLCALGSFAFSKDSVTTLEPQQPAPLQTNPKSPADHSTLLHPDQLQTLVETEGRVVSTDLTAHTIATTDLTGQPITLQTIANTRVLDPQNHPLTLADLKPKDHVRMYYDRKSNTVQQIDRLPTVGETILGK